MSSNIANRQQSPQRRSRLLIILVAITGIATCGVVIATYLGVVRTWQSDESRSRALVSGHANAADDKDTVRVLATDKVGTHNAVATVAVAVGPVVAAGGPQILLTPDVLAAARQQAAANSPRWLAFKARLDAQLGQVIEGDYQGSQLAWIADYALGYQVLKDTDPAAAAAYADKAIAGIGDGLNDYQKGPWTSRQFLARGDGSATAFALPNADLLPDSLKVYLAPVTTTPVVHSAAHAQDEGDYYSILLGVSNTPGGAPGYAQGADWRQSGDYGNNQVDWSGGGAEPAVGATYYVTATSGANATQIDAYTLGGHTITLATPPPPDQAVFVEYVYGTHAPDGSALAYQQTQAGDGGFNSIFVDDTYSSRYLGKFLAIGYDWLRGYAGFAPTLQARTAAMLVRWSDYVRDNGYNAGSPASNYDAGAYASRVMTALALQGRDPAGPRLVAEVLAYRRDNILPLLQAPTASLKGGFWAEGWNYGALAAGNILQAGLALEAAGLGAADAERGWASEAVLALVHGQPTRDTMYDGGDGFANPAPVPDKGLFYLLAAAAADPAARGYANRVIRTYPGADTQDYQDLLYRDPAAAAADWTAALPTQYLAAGTGLVTARADWGYRSTWLSFQLGNLLGADHQSYSPGQLQVQRGADALLVNANAVGGNQSGALKSTYSNAVVLDDNGAGTQVYRHSAGIWYGTPGVRLTAYEAGSGYVYAGGDYRAAYSLNTDEGGRGTATQLARQVVYLRPDVVVVHDRAGTVRPSDTKQLQWHFLNAPTVNGDSWVEKVGSSKLFGQTFSSVPLRTTSGRVVVGDATVSQVVTRNAAAAPLVSYVTALQTVASTAQAMVATTSLRSRDGRMEGVQAGNQVVLFGTSGAVDPAGGAIGYTVRGTAAVTQVLTDLQPGRSYTVRADGVAVATLTASAQGTVSFATTPSASGAQDVTVS